MGIVGVVGGNVGGDWVNGGLLEERVGRGEGVGEWGGESEWERKEGKIRT